MAIRKFSLSSISTGIKKNKFWDDITFTNDPFFDRVIILLQNGSYTNFGSLGGTATNNSTSASTTTKLSTSTASTNFGNGTGNVQVPYNSAMNDFSQGMTYEGYFYFTSSSFSGDSYFLGRWGTSGGGLYQFNCRLEGGNIKAGIRQNGTTSDVFALDAGAAPINQWVHVAFVLDGNGSSGTGRLFVNGVQAASSPYSIALLTNSFDTFGIGFKHDGGTFGGNAFFDRVRVTRKNRYTSNFTPPSVPLLTV
jgi:hypothetical protein